MPRRPIRIATTEQLARSVRATGHDVFVVPESFDCDFNRALEHRIAGGQFMKTFLENHDIELIVDFNTQLLTLLETDAATSQYTLTAPALGIPHVAMYLDPVTSTMANVDWLQHWQILENAHWIKGIFENVHAEELDRLGVPAILKLPMAASVDDFDTNPLPDPEPGPVIAFMGHPATSWFLSNCGVLPHTLFYGLTAAAVHADMPDMPFHKIYYDMYEFDQPPSANEDVATRAAKAQLYYSRKFVYNAYLAVKQRDRFAHFLKTKLGDNFELIGDFWGRNYDLQHTPREWDMKKLHQRMRQVPICLNLMKGNIESGLIVRHFEVTAYGGFLLTYATDQLAEYFEIGEECDVFHDEQELLEKISYYLQNPKRRREIALAGQRRTHQEHLYSHRVQSVVDQLFPVETPTAQIECPERTNPATTGNAAEILNG